MDWIELNSPTSCDGIICICDDPRVDSRFDVYAKIETWIISDRLEIEIIRFALLPPKISIATLSLVCRSNEQDCAKLIVY